MRKFEKIAVEKIFKKVSVYVFDPKSGHHESLHEARVVVLNIDNAKMQLSEFKPYSAALWISGKFHPNKLFVYGSNGEVCRMIGSVLSDAIQNIQHCVQGVEPIMCDGVAPSKEALKKIKEMAVGEFIFE